MSKQSKKKTQPKKTQPKKVPDWTTLDNAGAMIAEFSNFLESVETYRKSPQYSRELVKNIFEVWSETAAKEPKRKHQATLIKGFAEFLI